MMLEGVVTNVTNFGAFVDIGVHQDGLVHISALADQFVKDPHAVVKPGDLVTVKVIEVDVARNRIALSMRRTDQPAPQRPRDEARRDPPRGGGGRSRDQGRAAAPEAGDGALAAAFAKARRKD
jgi:uncharacterized protein